CWSSSATRNGIGLVNIVRKPAQVALLKSIGATHVCDMSVPTFMDDLTNALVETGATLAWDEIGGGRQAGQILACMEIAVSKTSKEIQPLWVDDPQAGLHLRRARSWTDGVQSRLRHGVGYRRLAPDGVPAEGWIRGGTEAARTCRARDQDDLREQIHEGRLADRSAAAERDRGVRQTGDRREIPHQAEQGSPLNGPRSRRNARGARPVSARRRG